MICSNVLKSHVLPVPQIQYVSKTSLSVLNFVKPCATKWVRIIHDFWLSRTRSYHKVPISCAMPMFQSPRYQSCKKRGKEAWNWIEKKVRKKERKRRKIPCPLSHQKGEYQSTLTNNFPPHLHIAKILDLIHALWFDTCFDLVIQTWWDSLTLVQLHPKLRLGGEETQGYSSFEWLRGDLENKRVDTMSFKKRKKPLLLLAGRKLLWHLKLVLSFNISKSKCSHHWNLG